MDIVAHALWGGAATVSARRLRGVPLRTGWALWWSVFPDVLAFGPGIALGLWFRLASGPNAATAEGHLLPHVHIALPLYRLGHSLSIMLFVLAVVSILARRPIFEMFGWLLHVLIDIPTHSERYYATRFLWPVSEIRFDGIAWWTPWFWIATYLTLLAVYILLWRKGWLRRGPWRPNSRASRRACIEV